MGSHVMEEKLRAYREKQRKAEFWQNVRQTCKKYFYSTTNYLFPVVANPPKVTTNVNKTKPKIIYDNDNSNTINVDAPPLDKFKILKFSFFWLICYIFFIYIEFGAVFFAVSLLIFIWKNTGTTPRRRGEVSAYSVFNDNCEEIGGTFSADQFERQVRSGMVW